jgi:hypothetical protein
MNNTVKSSLVVMVCALFATTAMAQTRWVSTEDDDWDNPDAWEPVGSPGINDDAEHEDEASTITVTNTAECKSFTGHNGSGRKLIIDAGNSLTVAEDLVGSPLIFFFPIDMISGTGPGDRTIINVGGNVDNIQFNARYSEHVEINVDEDVIESQIILQDHFSVEIGGDMTMNSYLHQLEISSADGIGTDYVYVTGNVLAAVNVIYNIGQNECTHGVPDQVSLPCDYLTLNFGSMGTEMTPIEGIKWYTLLTGYVHLKLDAGYYGIDDELPFQMRDQTILEVVGDTVGAKWLMEDNSIFKTGHGDIIKGIWILSDNARVTVANVEDGVWTVEDDAVVIVGDTFSPASLTIDDGDSVTCNTLTGFDPGEDEFEFTVILDDGASLEAGASTHQGTRDANASYV